MTIGFEFDSPEELRAFHERAIELDGNNEGDRGPRKVMRYRFSSHASAIPTATGGAGATSFRAIGTDAAVPRRHPARSRMSINAAAAEFGAVRAPTRSDPSIRLDLKAGLSSVRLKRLIRWVAGRGVHPFVLRRKLRVHFRDLQRGRALCGQFNVADDRLAFGSDWRFEMNGWPVLGSAEWIVNVRLWVRPASRNGATSHT